MGEELKDKTFFCHKHEDYEDVSDIDWRDKDTNIGGCVDRDDQEDDE